MGIILSWRRDECAERVLDGFYANGEESVLALVARESPGGFTVIVYPTPNDLDSVQADFEDFSSAVAFATETLEASGVVHVHESPLHA